MAYHLLYDNEEYEVSLNHVAREQFQAEIQGDKFDLEFLPVTASQVALLIDHVYHNVYFTEMNGRLYLFIEGEIFEIEWLEGKKSLRRAMSREEKIQAEKNITAPMPGRILKILVKAKQTVKLNQALFIVESMKMENEVQSPLAGKILKINFKENDLVSTGDAIIEFE